MNRIDNIGKIAGALTAVIVLVGTIIALFSKPDPVVIELRGGTDGPVPELTAPKVVATLPAAGDPARLLPGSQPRPDNAPAPDPEPNIEVRTPPPVPAPAVPLPAPAADAPDWTPEANLRVTEGQSVKVCPDGQQLSLSVAKQGTRPDTGIYLLSPRRSGRIEVGDTFSLSEECALKLDRTGKTGSYFAEISFAGTPPK